MGADFMHDYLFNTYLVGDTRQQDCFDVFAQYDWMATRELEVVAAVRYDYFSDGGSSRLTPKLNLRYRLLPNLSLRAGYGMGFRAPTLKEKYYNFDMSGIWIVEGNDKLKPEVSLTSTCRQTIARDTTTSRPLLTIISSSTNSLRQPLISSRLPTACLIFPMPTWTTIAFGVAK